MDWPCRLIGVLVRFKLFRAVHWYGFSARNPLHRFHSVDSVSGVLSGFCVSLVPSIDSPPRMSNDFRYWATLSGWDSTTGLSARHSQVRCEPLNILSLKLISSPWLGGFWPSCLSLIVYLAQSASGASNERRQYSTDWTAVNEAG
jgi:hypothetical protein